MSDSKVAGNLARLGYAARGAVYLTIGGLAVLAAAGTGGRATGSKGALQTLLEAPFGGLLLAVVAIGLFCFAAWRLAQAFLDADRLGHDRKALMRRTACGGSAAVYIGLAFTAGSILLGSHSDGGDQSARDWTAALMSEPFGRWLVAAVGVAFVIGAFAVARRGWTERFDRLAIPSEARYWAIPMGRVGFFARALVLLIVAGFLMLAALHANSSDAHGLAGALTSLQHQPYGWALLGLTALGLFAFGAFQFVMATYRRIDAPSPAGAAEDVEAGFKGVSATRTHTTALRRLDLH